MFVFLYVNKLKFMSFYLMPLSLVSNPSVVLHGLGSVYVH